MLVLISLYKLFMPADYINCHLDMLLGCICVISEF